MPTLNWIGKEKVMNHHLDVPYKVLNRTYSYDKKGQHRNDNSSENMIIHGDNLEVLKALLPKFEGKIDCIYIDPPYNTGNENWVYNDNQNDPRIKKWLGKVVGKEGEDYSRHDKWLCMMYPRLQLLHSLLAETGAIFISIDETEVHNLVLICNEIFGVSNYIGTFIWQKKTGGGQAVDYFVQEHEYILVYAKSNELNWVDETFERSIKEFREKDERGNYKKTKLAKWGNTARRQDRPTMYFPIKAPDGSDCYPIAPDNTDGRWRVGKAKVEELVKNDLIHWEKDGDVWIPYEKTYYEGQSGIIKDRSILYKFAETGDGTRCLTNVFGEKDRFENPKPPQLIERLIGHVTPKNGIVLDSYAGSGTTAHAVLNMNKKDGGNRKFILVEMLDYAEDITANRIKRVIKGYTVNEKVTTKLFDKKITLSDIKNSDFYKEIQSKYEELSENYDNVAQPRVVDGRVVIESIDEKNTKVEPIDSNFSFYELGDPIFVGDYLNENLDDGIIDQYIWFTETRSNYDVGTKNKNGLLGIKNNVAYYFIYRKDKTTKLCLSTLKTLTKKAKSFVIYADVCTLSEKELMKYNITFKKIPRGIARF